MTDPLSLLLIAGAFIAGGAVKGLAGLGLPIVTVAALTFAFGLKDAMALMVIPGLATNFFQAVTGGHMREALQRILVFLLPSLLTIWFGTWLLTVLDSDWLVAMLGVILTIYALTGIFGFTLSIPRSLEWLIGPIFGGVCGVTTGMTGVTSTPSVIYINGLGMQRDAFVQALGLQFFISYVVLSGSLWTRGLFDLEIGTLSLAATVPALVGLWLGRKMRLRTNEAQFKWIFYRVLLPLGLYMILRAWTG